MVFDHVQLYCGAVGQHTATINPRALCIQNAPHGRVLNDEVCFGRVFAEYQVLLAHPVKTGSYVESVQVWGRPEKLRGDARIVEYV